MSITIKDCPFCGHDDVEIDETGPSEFSVTCPECRCIGPITGDVISAITTWNKAAHQQKDEA
jgi:hypothetical protein